MLSACTEVGHPLDALACSLTVLFRAVWFFCFTIFALWRPTGESCFGCVCVMESLSTASGVVSGAAAAAVEPFLGQPHAWTVPAATAGSAAARRRAEAVSRARWAVLSPFCSSSV